MACAQKEEVIGLTECFRSKCGIKGVQVCLDPDCAVGRANLLRMERFGRETLPLQPALQIWWWNPEKPNASIAQRPKPRHVHWGPSLLHAAGRGGLPYWTQDVAAFHGGQTLGRRVAALEKGILRGAGQHPGDLFFVMFANRVQQTESSKTWRCIGLTFATVQRESKATSLT